MNRNRISNQTVLLPLLVMLLLTGLVGLTSYGVADAWRQTAHETVGQSIHTAVRAIMLTNIRWELYQIDQKRSSQPEIARKEWQDVLRQAQMLAGGQVNASDYTPLLEFMADESNMARIKSVLGQPLLNIRLNETQQALEFNLKRLEEYATRVNASVTFFMLFLGLVLTTITARDLDRLMRALAESRDLNIRVQEDERRRIAQDLHDGAIQEMIDLKRHYTPEKVERIIDNLRSVCHNLKPQVLEDLGLLAALEFLAADLRQAGIERVQFHVDAEGLSRLPKDYELPLFRMVQELFSNIKRHARATQVTLTVVYDPVESPMLSGYVADNGVGFDPARIDPVRMGIAGLRERVRQVNGRLKIESTPGEGSRFYFYIPVQTAKTETVHA